jgi:formate/nitrite transporter FocA (FNT family)
MAEPTRRNFGRAARLWAIVLCANLVGTGLAALFCALTPALDPALLEQMHIISRHAMAYDFWPMLLRGVVAGYLMAYAQVRHEIEDDPTIPPAGENA